MKEKNESNKQKSTEINPDFQKKFNKYKKDEMNDIIYGDHNDIFKIDDNINPDEHACITRKDRFEKRLNMKKIIYSGEYVTGKSMLDFICRVCGCAWRGQATYAVQHGCPECFRDLKMLKRARDIWTRTKNIIIDKKGIIVKIPEPMEDGIVRLTDQLVIKCGDCENLFTTTHKRLFDNTWCPDCAINRDKDKKIRTSAHTYRRNMKETTKFSKISKIAVSKQMQMESQKWQDVFKLTCSICGYPANLTVRQLCDNKYPCKNRCFATHKMRL